MDSGAILIYHAHISSHQCSLFMDLYTFREAARVYMCVCVCITFAGGKDFAPSLARGWKQPSGGMSRLLKLLWLPDGHNICYIRHVKRITGSSFELELEECRRI